VAKQAPKKIARKVPKPPAKAAAKPVKPAPMKVASGKTATATKSVPAKTVAARNVATRTVAAKTLPIKASSAKAMLVKAAAPARMVPMAKPARPLPRLAAMREAMAPPAVPVTPVPTNGKPRKNQVGITPRELEHFRDLLLAKRREIVGDMGQMEREALRTGGGSNLSNLPLHMADMGTDNYEQEFTLGLVEKERNLLREINSSLAKIMDGTYGVCEGTGKPISKVRLEAQPWARYSIEFARQKEQGFIR